MAKRASSSSSKLSAGFKKKAAASSEVAAKTPVRKTVVPKVAAPVAPLAARPAPAPITHDRIAERAYHIWRSGTGGSDAENWFRAEMELKNEAGL